MSVSPAVATGSPRADLPDFAAPAVVRDALLLVEDDDLVAMLLTQVLARLHWRVLRAGDGAEGERLLAEHRPAIALALVDCGLPDVEGAELCDRLRASVPGLPMLLTSGRDQTDLAQVLSLDGPAGFLPKPFLPGDVMRHVRDLLVRAA